MKAIINGKLVFSDKITEGVLLIDGDRIISAGDCFVPEGCETIDAKDDSRAAALAHLKHGTTQITPSAGYSLTKEAFLSLIDQCNEAIEKGDTNIVGIHFEGV